MKNKYYIPSIEEFHVGFEYEFRTLKGWETKVMTWVDYPSYAGDYIGEAIKEPDQIRVKYLDKQDIESLGFNNTKEHAVSYSSSYKIKDNKVFQIQSYWDMQRDERENLIRIYIGDLHKYPYTEIFRGEIKNISELKVLLKQLNIE